MTTTAEDTTAVADATEEAEEVAEAGEAGETWTSAHVPSPLNYCNNKINY